MTLDFIEDACDILDKDDSPYLLFVGEGKITRVFSNVGMDNIGMLEEWLYNGHWQEILRQHIERIKDA